MIRQAKTIQISTYNYNLLAGSIHLPNFFAKCSKQVVNSPNFLPAKLSCYTVPESFIDLLKFSLTCISVINNNTLWYVHINNI